MTRVSVAALLLVSSLFVVTAREAAAARLIPQGRWIVFDVKAVPEAAWTPWYSQGSWPVRYRFTCSNGAVIVNAQNIDRYQQGAPITAWDLEPDRATLGRKIANGAAEQNSGVTLPAGQSTTLQLYRPPLCSAPPQNLVFGVVYN